MYARCGSVTSQMPFPIEDLPYLAPKPFATEEITGFVDDKLLRLDTPTVGPAVNYSRFGRRVEIPLAL